MRNKKWGKKPLPTPDEKAESWPQIICGGIVLALLFVAIWALI